MVTNTNKVKDWHKKKNCEDVNELCFDKHWSCCLPRWITVCESVSLPQAQVCLASVYSQEPVRDGSKSVQYLKMAAESGVSGLLDASRVLSLAFSALVSPLLPVYHPSRSAIRNRVSAPSPSFFNISNLFGKHHYLHVCLFFHFLLQLCWSNSITYSHYKSL